MASIINRNGVLYLAWFDNIKKKNFMRSLKLEATSQNSKKAKILAKNFQKEIDKAYDEYVALQIVAKPLSRAYNHFIVVNSNKHPITIKEYDYFFERFKTHFDPTQDCIQITKARVEAWLINLSKNDKYSKNTLSGYCKVLTKFLGFLAEYNYTPVIKINRQLIIRPEIKPITIFEDEDLQLIINSLDTKNSNFRTTILLLIYTGLRPSDIYNIKSTDIDLNKKILRYYSEKTSEHFMVPLHPELIPVLEDRLKVINGKKLLEYETINNIGKAVRRYFKKLKINGKGYNLRTFRKTFISISWESGIDVASTARLVGHKNISTTLKYYTKFNPTKLSEQLERIIIIKPNNGKPNESN